MHTGVPQHVSSAQVVPGGQAPSGPHSARSAHASAPGVHKPRPSAVDTHTQSGFAELQPGNEPHVPPMHSMLGGAVVDVVVGPGEPTVSRARGAVQAHHDGRGPRDTGGDAEAPQRVPTGESRVTRFARGAFIPAVVAAVSGGHGDLPVARTIAHTRPEDPAMASAGP